MVDPYLDVWVVPVDITPLEYIEVRIGYEDVYGFWMRRREDGSCIAFDKEKRECTIYQLRPKECRDFNQDHEVCERIVREQQREGPSAHPGHRGVEGGVQTEGARR